MKRQILAIDGSKAIRFLLQTVLGKEYEVISFADGYSAMHWLSKSKSPNLIITDPQLPGMEDWELIQQLSTSGIHGAIPILALSSMDKSETAVKCLEYGVRQHFLKPFNPVELLRAIRHLVSDHALENV